ncbi:hypothetical protein BJX99DRAFT_262993 [Aspergillus californicus]
MHFLTSALLLSLSLTNTATAQAFERPHGIDSGNTICTGACVPDPGLLSCDHIELRPQYGCFMCCISDDDLDILDEMIGERDDQEENADKHE